jgi:hypothetical protein
MTTTVNSSRSSITAEPRVDRPATTWRRSGGRGGASSIRPVFSGSWKRADASYSIVLAQAPSLAAQYRRLFLLGASHLVTSPVSAELKLAAEAAAAVGYTGPAGALGSVTAFVRFDSGIGVGIENRKPHGVDRKGQLRYDEYLRLRNPDPILMLLMPGSSVLVDAEAEKLDRFVPLNCDQLIGWADGCLVDWLNCTVPKIDTLMQTLEPLL